MPRGKSSPKTYRPRKRSRRNANNSSSPAASIDRIDRYTNGGELINLSRTAPGGIHRFSQVVNTINLVQQAGSNSYYALGFLFNQLDQYATFQALFDEYRFDRVELTFFPAYRANNVGLAPTTLIPLIYVVADYDDGVTPTTISQLREYESCVVRDDSRPFTISIVPRLNISLASGASLGQSPTANVWIDMASTNTPLYGVKLAIQGAPSGTTSLQEWQLSIRYHISCRNVR